MTFDELKEKAHALPLKPGVYIMQDKHNVVIYVGKAKALKNRVSQYFADLASHTEKTRAMVSQIDHFDVIVADSEFEALVLESSLIKRHQPHYNILLKDDKGYPYIRLTVNEDYPRFSLAPGRSQAALLQPEIPPGHRQGAALPELPHGPVRRLLPVRHAPGAVPGRHRPGHPAAGGTVQRGRG